jgi:hypothetical protein
VPEGLDITGATPAGDVTVGIFVALATLGFFVPEVFVACAKSNPEKVDRASERHIIAPR